MRHPPELNRSDCALFLDFDGTLVPIVERPELTTVDDRTRESLSRAMDMTEGAVAVLSGRALGVLDDLLSPLRLVCAGSHGLEIRGPAEKIRPGPTGADYALASDEDFRTWLHARTHH